MNIGWFKPSWKSFWEFLRLVRVDNLLLLAITQLLVRTFLIGPKSEWELYWQSPWLWSLLFCSACIVGGGFVINDYYDVKIDAVNYPDRVVLGRGLKRRWAIFWHTALNAVGIGGGFFLSWRLGLMYLAGAVLVWFYSHTLKRLPLVGNISLGVLSAIAIFAVGVYYKQMPLTVYLFAGFAYFLTIIRAIIKDMADLRGDLQFGCRTLPIIWGIRRTKTLLYVLLGVFLIIAAVLLFQINRPMLNYYFVALSPAIALFIYRLYWADTNRSYLYLNNFCKFLMATGIAAMTLV